MSITPKEKEILSFVQQYTAHNSKKFGVSSITQAQIAEKFGFTKQNMSLYGKSMEMKGLIKRQKGKGAAFWEIV